MVRYYSCTAVPYGRTVPYRTCIGYDQDLPYRKVKVVCSTCTKFIIVDLRTKSVEIDLVAAGLLSTG
eukprot:SAG31_NODE_345_length_17358_cov_61.906889_9_plen_67_part_00